MELKSSFPNYVQAINQMKDSTDLSPGRSNSRVFSNMMSFVVFGNKLGDISIDLNKYEDFVYVSIQTYAGFTERAKTTGERIYQDLSVEEWIEEIARVTTRHNSNPNHIKLLENFTEKKLNPKSSGCASLLILLLVLSSAVLSL